MRTSLLVAGLLFAAKGAWAQPVGPDVTQRRALILDAETAQRAGNHDLALQRALDAAAIQMTPSLRRLIADEYEALGRYRNALAEATTCAREAETSPNLNNREALLRHCQELAARVRAQAAWVRLEGVDRLPLGAQVSVNGEQVAPDHLNAEMIARPGTLVVRVELGDETSVERRALLQAGAHVALPLPLPAARPFASDATPPVGSYPTHEYVRRGPGAAPWVVVGVGVASLVAAGVVYGTVVSPAIDDLNRVCTDVGGYRTCSANPAQAAAYDARRLQGMTVTNVALGAGGVAVVSGLLWFFLSPRDAPATVRTTLLRDGAALGVEGRF